MVFLKRTLLATSWFSCKNGPEVERLGEFKKVPEERGQFRWPLLLSAACHI